MKRAGQTRSWRQQELPLPRPEPAKRRGGARPNSGRPKGRVSRFTPHLKRQTHWKSSPVHITMRGLPRIVSLRHEVPFSAARDALRSASRTDFRILHFSVQADHVHVIAEADSGDALRTGAQGLAIRLARAINRALRRKGKLWAHRHERHDLRSPRQVRNAIVYVLFNLRKHARGRTFEAWARRELDPCSSATWFEGWTPRAGPALARLRKNCPAEPVVVEPKTWLATTGWRTHGLIEPFEMPR